MGVPTTYSELITTLGQWAWRAGAENETDDDTFVSQIPMFIRDCEDRVSVDLRVGDMLKTDQIIMVSGEGDLPSDYLQLRRVSEDAYPSIDLLPGGVRNGRGFVISGGTLRGYPNTIGDMTIEYYARIPHLSEQNPTNWLLQKAPSVYIYGSLLAAAPFSMEDSRAGTWRAFYQNAIDGLTSNDTLARYARSGRRSQGCNP